MSVRCLFVVEIQVQAGGEEEECLHSIRRCKGSRHAAQNFSAFNLELAQWLKERSQVRGTSQHG